MLQIINKAIFNAEEKPMLLMRYIRKHIQILEAEREKTKQTIRTESTE